jgi:Tfp pilus assembly protein PilV
MSRLSMNSHSRRRGYALLEAMLAVAIFALGVLGLGRCISRGMAVERIEAEDARVYRLLENRAAEIEAGAVPITDSQEKIASINGGVVLTQKREAVHKTDEHGQELANLSLITLEATWMSSGERQSHSLNLYVSTRQP